MQNVLLMIAYVGSNYAGWQVQKSALGHAKLQYRKASEKPTIQGEIEQALQKIFQKKIKLIGSGRTDAGVHAVGQVANFKIDQHLDMPKLVRALNGILPKDISIIKAQEVGPTFHARFDAKLRAYRFIIINGPKKPIFCSKLALWVKYPLDVALMRREAKVLCGQHDFKSFQAADHIERNSLVVLKKIDVRKIRRGSVFPFFSQHEAIVIDIIADRFLRNMVRNIVGTLIEIGRGKMVKGELKRILSKKNRDAAGPCISGCGLYLLKVDYK